MTVSKITVVRSLRELCDLYRSPSTGRMVKSRELKQERKRITELCLIGKPFGR
jgi:hypothetical protein